MDLIFGKLIIFLRIDKIILAINELLKTNRKREDLKKIRDNDEMANIARVFRHDKFAEFYDKKAKTIRDTKE